MTEREHYNMYCICNPTCIDCLVNKGQTSVISNKVLKKHYPTKIIKKYLNSCDNSAKLDLWRTLKNTQKTKTSLMYALKGYLEIMLCKVEEIVCLFSKQGLAYNQERKGSIIVIKLVFETKVVPVFESSQVKTDLFGFFTFVDRGIQDKHGKNRFNEASQ
jgi:hypothetical protein